MFSKRQKKLKQQEIRIDGSKIVYMAGTGMAATLISNGHYKNVS